MQLQARVDMGAMAIEGYSTFHNAPALLEPHHQFSDITRSLVTWGHTPLQSCNQFILQPQLTGLMNTKCNLEDLPGAMKDKDGCREKIRELPDVSITCSLGKEN